MRRRRNTNIAKQYIAFFMNQQYAKLILGIVAAIIVGIVAFLIIDATRAPTIEETDAYQEGNITVGLVTGTPFCSMTEDGSFTGFEAEVAREIISRLYGDTVSVKYVEISDQITAYALKTEQIDIAFGMMTSGVTKTLGLDICSSYYEDPVYLYVAEGNKNMPVSNLAGRRALVMVSDILKSDVQSALEERGISDVDLVSSASYADANESVQLGISTGVFSGYYKMTDTSLKLIDDVITHVPYSPIIWRDADPMFELLNAEIEQMRSEGYFEEVAEKWGLLLTQEDE